MESIDFIFNRLLATRSAAETFTDTWEWSEKTAGQFAADVTRFDLLQQQEGAADLAVQNAAGEWEAVLSSVARQAGAVKRYAITKFRNEEGKLRLWRGIGLNFNSRAATYRIGCLVRDAWRDCDLKWAPEDGLTCAAFTTLVAKALDRQTNHQSKLNAWRKAAGDLTMLARACEQDCIHWYRDACTRFPEETAEGQTLRSTVPTSARPVEPVGQAEITHLSANGGEIHFDCAAPHATRFTYLHRPPGVPQYFVLVADSTARNITLKDQPPGEHSFKAIGSNSRGTGTESEAVAVTVAEAKAA